MNATTFIILTLLTLLSVVAICWSLRTVWREMSGCGEGTEADIRRTEERKNARIKKEIERWRNAE